MARSMRSRSSFAVAAWMLRSSLAPASPAMAVGIGAALSQVIAGSIVHHMGSHAGFLFLAEVASAAFAILYFFMPETRNARLVEE